MLVPAGLRTTPRAQRMATTLTSHSGFLASQPVLLRIMVRHYPVWLGDDLLDTCRDPAFLGRRSRSRCGLSPYRLRTLHSVGFVAGRLVQLYPSRLSPGKAISGHANRAYPRWATSLAWGGIVYEFRMNYLQPCTSCKSLEVGPLSVPQRSYAALQGCCP